MKRLVALALAGATFAAGATPPSGSVLHYIRSNRDGSEPERVIIYLPEPGQISVFKQKARCTNAAYVTATVDPATGRARELVGGRLARDGSQQAFAWLRPRGDQLVAFIGARGAPGGPAIPLPSADWHLYDFDLASLIAVPPAALRRRSDFAFDLPLVWVGEGAPALRSLGRAELRFEAMERHGGRQAYRYRAAGPAFGMAGGPIWFDAADGAVIEAQWGIPNHAEYRDFRLRLIRRGKGAAEWGRVLAAHWAGCPSR